MSEVTHGPVRIQRMTDEGELVESSILVEGMVSIDYDVVDYDDCCNCRCWPAKPYGHARLGDP